MTTLLVEHRVTDYATWKAVYDEVDPIRVAAGVTSHRILRKADDPDLVVVEHAFPDAASAGAFLQNPELGEAMKRGGVVVESVRPMILEDGE